MKVTQMPPVHTANLVANSGNTAYGVDVIATTAELSCGGLYPGPIFIISSLSVGWNYLSIPKLQRCSRWSLGIEK